MLIVPDPFNIIAERCCWGSELIVPVGLGMLTDTWNAQPSLLRWTSILYPGGRNVLKPTINSGNPLNRFDTRWMTPGTKQSIRSFKG